jgi:hypothetical protein
MREEQGAAIEQCAARLRSLAEQENEYARRNAKWFMDDEVAGKHASASIYAARAATSGLNAQALIAGAAAIEALARIEDEADTEADCDDGPEGIANRPNLAMRVQMLARAALAWALYQSVTR